MIEKRMNQKKKIYIYKNPGKLETFLTVKKKNEQKQTQLDFYFKKDRECCIPE